MISARILWGGGGRGIVFPKAHVTSAQRVTVQFFVFGEQRWRVVWAWVFWF